MQSDQPRSNPVALAVALAAFTVCFFAWSMLGPLGPTLQTHLHLSEFKLALVVAIPVVLGSLMRIPVGILADRFGGRIVFTVLMAYSIIPLVLLALFHDSFAAVVVLGFLLGLTGASFAVGVPFVNRWYDRQRQGFALACTEWAWAAACAKASGLRLHASGDSMKPGCAYAGSG